MKCWESCYAKAWDISKLIEYLIAEIGTLERTL